MREHINQSNKQTTTTTTYIQTLTVEDELLREVLGVCERAMSREEHERDGHPGR